MSKKLLVLLTSVATLCSAPLYAATVEIGVENERYDNVSNASDVYNPYITTNFKPIDGSPLNISMKYMYQDQYGKDHIDGKNGFKTKRDRFEMFANGYSWKEGNYTFSPKVGFRYEQWKINDETSTSRQEQRRLEFRFYPNMTYKVTSSTTLYMDGFVGPVLRRTKQPTTTGDILTDNFRKNYYQELEVIGVKQALENGNSLWASLYTEVKYNDDSSSYNRLQLRGGYNWAATAQLNINPFIRQDLYYKEKNITDGSSTYGDKKRKNEMRIGTKLSYKVLPTFMISGEVYRQIAQQQQYDGSYSTEKNRMFYKLAITQTF